MIVIDGSKYEGGGSILRTALAYSLTTQKPFKIINIRKNRNPSGLKNQHLASIKLAQMISNSAVENAELGSETITFYPNKIKKGTYNIDIGTAGSITLLLQSVLLPIIVSSKKISLRLKGGTDVNNSPTFDYFKYIFLNSIKEYSDFKIELLRRGYYPKGNGRINIEINPKYNDLDKEEFKKIDYYNLKNYIKVTLRVNASKHYDEFFLQQINEYFKLLSSEFKKYNIDSSVITSYNDSDSKGGSYTIEVQYYDKNENVKIIGDSNVFLNEKPQSIVEESIIRIKNIIENKIVCDKHLSDQLISFLSFFGGRIKAEKITEHVKANVYVSNLFFKNKILYDEEKKIIFLNEKVE